MEGMNGGHSWRAFVVGVRGRPWRPVAARGRPWAPEARSWPWLPVACSCSWPAAPAPGHLWPLVAPVAAFLWLVICCMYSVYRLACKVVVLRGRPAKTLIVVVALAAQGCPHDGGGPFQCFAPSFLNTSKKIKIP